MRRSLLLSALAALLLTAGSCDDGPSGPPPPEEGFSIRVEVVDDQGQPVEGLDVALWNRPTRNLNDYLQDDFFKRRAATSVRFVAAETCSIEFRVDDVLGRPLWNYSGRAAVGAHELKVGPDLEPTGGLTIYAYTLTCYDDTTGAELFSDTKYMTRLEVDRDLAVVGKTDGMGWLELAGEVWAPALHAPEEMPIVDETGTQMGVFSLVDTLMVRIYDADGNYVQVDRPITEGTNVIKATWDITALKRQEPAASGALPPPVRLVDVGEVPEVFSLRQNYPNPFN